MADNSNTTPMSVSCNINNYDNQTRLIAWATAQIDPETNEPMAIPRAIKALLFATVPTMVRADENERKPKQPAPISLLEAAIGKAAYDKLTPLDRKQKEAQLASLDIAAIVAQALAAQAAAAAE